MTTTPIETETAAPQSRAVARYVRTSASKARRVVNLIRGASANDAVAILRFAPQAASEQVLKVLQSAMANAEHNFGLDPDALRVASTYVDEGPTLRRFRPRAQGSAGQIRKRSCHITVVLEVDERTEEESARGRSRNRSRRSR